MDIRDQMLISLDTDDAVIAAGNHYGSDIPIQAAGRFIAGKVMARVTVTTAFTGAGNTTITLCSGSAASPTTILKTLLPATAIAGLTAGSKYEVVLNTHELSAFSRFNVNQSGTGTAGAVIAELIPIN